MPAALNPTEAALWPFALACTNDAVGAARVLASMVRDHGDLGKISDSRLRRSILERSRIWQERVRAEPGAAGESLASWLDGHELEERALLWLEAGEGQGVVELSWILRVPPEGIRAQLDTLDAHLGAPGRQAAAEQIRATAQGMAQDDLRSRLDEARRVASSRNRRRAALVFACFAIFVGVMLFVLYDLLTWQDAKETLPNQTRPAPIQGPAP